MSQRPGAQNDPSAYHAPSFLTPRHWVDPTTTVRVDRRVHGTDSPIGGTAAYKHGMDVIFTVHCQLCRMDVDAAGTCHSWYPQQRVHYGRADPDRWWRVVLETVRRHHGSVSHRHAVMARAFASRGRGFHDQ